jgi:small subunit ribosomal protein S16
MLKIRLKRVGRKHNPSFRIVVTEITAPPKGKYKEAVGFYNSALKQLQLNKERVRYWLGVGAQPTDVVHNILVKDGIIDAPKRKAHSTRIRKEEPVQNFSPQQKSGAGAEENIEEGSAQLLETGSPQFGNLDEEKSETEKAPKKEPNKEEKTEPLTIK